MSAASFGLSHLPALLVPLVLTTGATAGESLVKTSSGINHIDLDGDGRTDAVVKAWRENFNAHGFFHYAFYRIPQSGVWQVLPVEFSPTEAPGIGFSTRQGADCVLEDLRLLRRAAGDVALITASREVGKSFGDPEPVNFARHELERNVEGLPGRPELYFTRTKSWTTYERYCDVGEAFREELGLK